MPDTISNGISTITEGRSKKKRNNKSLRWIAFIGLVAAIVAVVLLRPETDGRMVSHGDYTEEAVQERTISSALSGSGVLQPANSYTVTALVQGDILAADFEEGDIVEKDTVLYVIDSSDIANNIERNQISLNQAQRNYENLLENQYIRASISGQLYRLDVEVGDEVVPGQTVALIRESDTMTLTVPFHVNDAETLYVGQEATVALDGSFETLPGTIKMISGSNIVGPGNVITRNITISVQNPGALSTSQTATVNVGDISCVSAGNFTYLAERTITTTVAGTILSISQAEGDQVTKGQVLITLGGDDLEDALQGARESIRNAELSMDSTQNQLGNYIITSPIQGTIVDKKYKAGDTIEGNRSLCIIYDLSYLEMTIDIDELDISAVTVGQQVQITAEAVEGRTYEGTITKVSLVGNIGMGGATSYPVTVRIDETDGLRPSMNADAEIVLETAENTLSIPCDAVKRGGQVLVTADSPSAENALEREAPDGYAWVEVETGISDDNYIQVLSGLQAGDVIAYENASSSSVQFGPQRGAMGGGMGGGPAQ